MQLTKQTDFSLRILMYLGVHADRLCNIKEITRTYGLSAGHVMKIVNELGRAGYIETVRGRGGGIRLAHDPAELNIGEIVRFSEQNLALVECFQAETNTCPLARFCVLGTALHKALEGFFAVLDEYTLQDLIKAPGRMRSTLAASYERNAPPETAA